MPRTYSQPWGGSNPGCLILLLDQSGSMSDPFGNQQAGAGKRKCDMVATVLNGFLNELIVTNTIAHNNEISEVRPRADVAVLGYSGSSVGSVLGGSLYGKDFVSLPELQVNPLEIETRRRKEIDDIGLEIEIPVQFPIWVKPRAEGGTPMCKALRQARDLAATWARSHPDNYPPVIINVTDGIANDGDPAEAARELNEISTSDGQALLFNVHITDINSAPIMYPSNEYELPTNKHAAKLFAMSSLIPEASRAMLESLINKPVPPGTRDSYLMEMPLRYDKCLFLPVSPLRKLRTTI